MKPRPRWFAVACLAEIALGLGALVFFWLSGHSLGRLLVWDVHDLTIGAVAAVPMFGVLLALVRGRWEVCTKMRQVFDGLVRPLFGDWSVAQLATISIIAGICEELLFRGALQQWLAKWTGTGGALALTSLLFGAAHFLTLEYAVITAAIGAYLGVLWLETGNLLVPMVAHALYDFAALIYLLRVNREGPPPANAAESQS